VETECGVRFFSRIEGERERDVPQSAEGPQALGGVPTRVRRDDDKFNIASVLKTCPNEFDFR
jgi:hypothetical protein